MESNNVMAEGLTVSLNKPLEWTVGLSFENTELCLERRESVSGILGFDD